MKATYKRGKMYFDNEAWALIKRHATKQHKSPTVIVVQALKRGFKNAEKQKALESSSLPGSSRP